MAQKLYFGFNAAHTRKSAQATGSCNTVTGNNDRDRVCAARLTDSLRRGADYLCNFAIGFCLTEWNGPHFSQNRLLQWPALRRQRQVKLGQIALRIGDQLSPRLNQQRRLFIHLGRTPVKRGDSPISLFDRKDP